MGSELPVYIYPAGSFHLYNIRPIIEKAQYGFVAAPPFRHSLRSVLAHAYAVPVTASIDMENAVRASDCKESAGQRIISIDPFSVVPYKFQGSVSKDRPDLALAVHSLRPCSSGDLQLFSDPAGSSFRHAHLGDGADPRYLFLKDIACSDCLPPKQRELGIVSGKIFISYKIVKDLAGSQIQLFPVVP